MHNFNIISQPVPGMIDAFSLEKWQVLHHTNHKLNSRSTFSGNDIQSFPR